jgi:uncharacterized membrane protein
VSERVLRRVILLLALLGAGIAGYLTYVRATGGSVVCTTGGCEKVQSSSYAEVLGIPVAVLGLVGYLLLGTTTLVAGEAAAAAGAALASAGFAFSVYLIYIQLAVVDAICVWCLASDGVMTLLLAATFLRLRTVVRPGAVSEGSPG